MTRRLSAIAALIAALISTSVFAGDIANQITNAEAGDDASCPAGPDTTGPQGPSAPQSPSHRGNPINVASGNKFHKETIYRGVGEFPLEYSVYYNSRFINSDGTLSGRWTTSYSQFAYIDDEGYTETGNFKLLINREDGQVISFIVDGDKLVEQGRISSTHIVYSVSLVSGRPDGGGIDLYVVEETRDDGNLSVKFVTMRYERPDGFAEQYDPRGMIKEIESPEGLVHKIKRKFHYEGEAVYPDRFDGPALCKVWKRLPESNSSPPPSGGAVWIEATGDGGSGGTSTVSFTPGNNSPSFEYGPPQCIDRSNIRYLNWECRTARGGFFGRGGVIYQRCLNFAHKDAQCLGTYPGPDPSFSSSEELRNAIISGEGNLYQEGMCDEWEAVFDGELQNQYIADVVVEDSYGNTITWTEESLRPLSGSSCDGCTSELTTPVGSFGFGIDPDSRMITDIANPDASQRLYLYEHEECSSFWRCETALTGIEDEEGKRHSSWEYLDTTQSNSLKHAGRAWKSYHGVGDEIRDVTEIEYTDGHNRIVRNELGAEQTLNFSADDGYIFLNNVESNVDDLTNCSSSNTVYNHDSRRRVSKITMGSGPAQRTLDYTYHGNSNQIESITEAKGTSVERKAVYTWHPELRRRISSIELYEDGNPVNTTSYKYWPNGRLKTRTVTDNTSHTEPYTTAGRSISTGYTYEYWDQSPGTLLKKITIDGPRVNVEDKTVIEYDEQGRMTSYTNALGHKTTFEDFHEAGLPKRIVDANGYVLEVNYNYRGQVTLVREGGMSSIFAYRDNGLLRYVLSDDHDDRGYQYDSARRLSRVVNLAGGEVEMVSEINPLDSSLRNMTRRIYSSDGTKEYEELYQLDALGRLYKWVGENDPLVGESFETERNYNNVGDLTKFTKGDFIQEFEPDSLGRTKKMVQGDGGEVDINYDALNKVTSVTDAIDLNTTYKVDGFGRVIQLDSPDTGTTKYYYDKAGNVILEVDNRGESRLFRYDALNRLEHIDYEDDRYDVYFTYDYDNFEGEPNKGLRSLAVSHSGFHQFSHNQQGMLDKKGTYINGTWYQWSYDIDAYGKTKEIQYPSGRTVKYEYSAKNVVEVKMITEDGREQEVISGVKYKPFGPVKSYDYGNGIHYNAEFNQQYMLESVEETGVKRLNVQYNSEGLVSAVVDHSLKLSESDDSQEFLYDDNLRLSDVYEHFTSGEYFSYKYDKNGNRTHKHAYEDYVLKNVELYKVDEKSNRITELDETFPLKYNDIGQLKRQPKTGGQYFYGDNKRLREYSPMLSSSSYYYDYGPFGERVVKRTENEEIHFLYDGPNLMAEYDAISGEVIREYIYALGKLVAVYSTSANGRNEGLHFVHTDQVGAPTHVTNQDTTVVWKGRNRGFGEGEYSPDPDGDLKRFTMPIRYPGQYVDLESGLYYNYFRYYDPSLGRYITSDPIGLAGGANTYAYAGGDPVNYVDPYGLCFGLCTAAGIGFTWGASEALVAVGLLGAVAHGAATHDDAIAGLDSINNGDVIPVDPNDPVIPGFERPTTGSHTEVPTCPPGGGPELDPKDQCVQTANFLKSVCIASGKPAAMCRAMAVIRIMMCRVTSPDSGD